jgi:RNA polymerase sigma-70 factor (ECF subfamily)
MALPGSRARVEQLVDNHYQALYRYAYRLAGSAADAEDLTQETFCRAQTNWSQLRDPGCAKPWLFRILRNLYLHKLRSEKQHHCLLRDDLSEVPGPLPDPLPPIDDRELQDALAELPEAYRTPLILFYYDDFSYREIAEQMELPLGTVMSRLARGKAHLRGRLLPAEPEPALGGQRRGTDGL